MKILLPVIANLLLLVAVFGLGGVLRPLIPKSFLRIDRLAIIALGGIGLLGSLLFLVGLIRFTPATILAVLIPSALLGAPCLAQETKDLLPDFKHARPPVIAFAVVAAILAITILGGLVEPVGDIKLDAISYHFLGPKVWLRAGVIVPALDEARTSFPAIVETQFAALMAIGGLRAPELFAFLSLTSMLFLAAGLTRRLGLDAAAAWWVAALICTMPALYRGAFGGFNDVVYSGLILAAVRLIFDAESRGHFTLVGLFCGFAMGAKYTGLLATAILFFCALLIATAGRRAQIAPVFKLLLIAGLVAIAVASPWYARNWIVMGCPMYPPPPVLPRFFQIRYFPPAAVLAFHHQMLLEGMGMGRDLLSFLLLPFHLTFHPANFLNGAGGIGLVPLALGPFGLLACRWDRFTKGLGLFGLLQTIVWFITMQESRYLIHVYVIAAIFGVCGWKYVVRVAKPLGPTLAALVVATSVLYGLFVIVAERKDDLHAAMSASFAEKRRKAEIPYLDSFNYLNEEPSVTKVLILDPLVPPYYLDKNYLKPFGKRKEQVLPNVTNLQELMAELPGLHVSHIWDVRSEERGFQLPDPPQNSTLIFHREDQRIYRIDPGPRIP